MKKEKLKRTMKKKQKMEEEGPWSDLHEPLLELIASLLPFLDYLFRFRAVCRSWRSIRQSPPQLPQLIFADHGNKKSERFLGLSDQLIGELWLPELRGFKCLASVDGWVLMQPGYYGERLIINPISGENYRLPEYYCFSHSGLYGMPLPPTDPRCVVAIFLTDHLYYYHLWGDKKCWCIMDFKEELDEFYLDIAYYKGKIYALNNKRNLECFESFPDHRCELVEMDSSCIPNDESYKYLIGYYQRVCWLVESREELFLCVEGDHEDESIMKLFRADLLNKAWVAVQGVEDRFLLC